MTAGAKLPAAARDREAGGGEAGARVADVGAGTGVFSMLLSDAVGPDGVVYAEEVVDRFSRYIAERAEHDRRANVVSVLGTETSVGLPPRSIDLAFLCDVYHHFDKPAPMLASIRGALREGGELFLVDFIREPGHGPDWVFEHVRASEATVTRRESKGPDSPCSPPITAFTTATRYVSAAQRHGRLRSWRASRS